MYRLFLFCLVVFTIGCTSQQTRQSSSYKPDFVDFLPREKGTLFAVGHVTHSDAVVAQREADQNAKLELVFLFAQKAQHATLATFTKAELNRGLYEKFLSRVQDGLLALEYPESKIDRREYTNEIMYSLAKCAYSPQVIERLKAVIVPLIKNDEALYKSLVQKNYFDDLIMRLNKIEEY